MLEPDEKNQFMQFFRTQAGEILDLKTDAIKKEFDINNKKGAFSLFCESLKNDSDGIKEQFDMNDEHSAFSKRGETLRSTERSFWKFGLK